MKQTFLFFTVVCLLVCTGQGFATLTPTFDADLSEWVGPDVVNLGTRPDPDGGSYTLLAAWDETNLYLGMDRSNTSRYLDDGDGWGLIDSFFVAFDVDGVIGSGASVDGYSRANFGGDYLPDYFVYYAGGPHWYEHSSWNGSSMDWLGWTDSGAVYGNPGWGDDDEFAISLTNVGGDDGQVMIWAWMTRENNGYVETSWPSGDTSTWSEETGTVPPVFGDGFLLTIPEPATMAMFGLGSLLLALRRKK